MYVARVFFLLSLAFLSSCAHTSIRTNHDVSQSRDFYGHISSAFIRIQTIRTYRILACSEVNTTQCRVLTEASGPAGFGSGGIIRHNVDSTDILTATHVIDEFEKAPPVDLRSVGPLLSQFSMMYGISPDEIKYRLQKQHLRIQGVRTTLVAVASDGKSYEVKSTDCHDSADVCLIRTNLINDIEPLAISKNQPQMGDRSYMASGPFGYAIPGMMVPLFEGIFSGQTPDNKDYYTIHVTPGSSGSLIVNHRGEVIGVVSMFITGSFCPEPVGCQVLPSGITVSVPLAMIHDLLTD